MEKYTKDCGGWGQFYEIEFKLIKYFSFFTQVYQLFLSSKCIGSECVMYEF